MGNRNGRGSRYSAKGADDFVDLMEDEEGIEEAEAVVTGIEGGGRLEIEYVQAIGDNGK